MGVEKESLHQFDMDFIIDFKVGDGHISDQIVRSSFYVNGIFCLNSKPTNRLICFQSYINTAHLERIT